MLGLAALGAASYSSCSPGAPDDRLSFGGDRREGREVRSDELRSKWSGPASARVRNGRSVSGYGSGGSRLADAEHLLAEIGEMAVRHNLQGFGLTVAPAAGSAQGGAAPDPAAASAGAPAQEREGAVEARFCLTFRSTYRDLAEFLDAIPRARRLLTIRSVSVREKADAMAAEMLGALHRGKR